MTSIATSAAKRLISQHAKQFEPEDPFYQHWTDAKGKQRRRKRPPPPGLTKAEAQCLKKIARRAHYLDKGFYICGLRFGWTFIIGVIPGVGDVADASLNYFLVLNPAKKGLDLPEWLVRRMVTNNVISAGIGFIPLAGDIALAVFKANSRNVKLVEEYLRVLGEEHMAAGLPNLTPDPPALPGGQQPNETSTPHPAQPAAKQMVKDHSGAHLTNNAQQSHQSTVAAAATGTTTSAATGTPASNAAQAPMAEKKKWWQMNK